MSFRASYAEAARELRHDLANLGQTNGPGRHADTPVQYVEVYGLESESGKLLNGQNGLVVKHIEETERFDVQLGLEKVVRLKAHNLRCIDLQVGDLVETSGFQFGGCRVVDGSTGRVTKFLAELGRFQVCLDGEKTVHLHLSHVKRLELAPGDRVCVTGLESEGGKLLSGQAGFITAIAEAGRLQVRLDSDKLVSLRGENLQRPELGHGDAVDVCGLEGEGACRLNGQRGRISGVVDDAGCIAVRFSLLNEHHGGLKKLPLPFAPSDCVEVCGLPPASGGRDLNGKQGRVSRYIRETGLFQVDFGPSKLLSLQAGNLRRVPGGLVAGDRVEVHGLESAAGRELNGMTGMVVEYVRGVDRFEVLFVPERLARLRSSNLRHCASEAA